MCPCPAQPAGSSWELLPGKVTRVGAGPGLALGLETSGVSRWYRQLGFFSLNAVPSAHLQSVHTAALSHPHVVSIRAAL